jgi:hypothetical protein
MESNDASKEAQVAGPRQRSPQHPAFSLAEAIEKARKLMEEENATLVPASVALEHWGYSAKSSSGLRTIASMLEYGLVDDQGAGSEKKVRASERARLLVRHPDHSSDEYVSALKDAALSPAIFRAIYEAYPDGLPTDATLTWELERRWGFGPTAIPNVIASLRETFELAKLLKPDKVAQIDPRMKAIAEKLQLRDLATQAEKKDEKSAMNEEVFSLTEGAVTLRWPSKISPESFQDFSAWLDLVKRKASRASAAVAAKHAEPNAPPADENGGSRE